MGQATSASKSVKARPALKLVKTNDLSRDDWLEVRRGGIGSSDAAAAVGLNPYKSQLELWIEKTGRDASLPKTDPNDETSPMYWDSSDASFVAFAWRERSWS
jgi:putative phage-type endonuclease